MTLIVQTRQAIICYIVMLYCNIKLSYYQITQPSCEVIKISQYHFGVVTGTQGTR